MSKSILIHENGGPEKMQLADVEVGSPGPGQVKIRHTAIGLNFIDVYTRSGLYQTPLPNAVGREAAGVIVEVGPKVKGFKKGDRVAYCGMLGAYCQERLMTTEQLVHVPKGVSDEEAAAIMLKGMTTEYLVDHTPKGWLKKGDIILFHAAAGGVGLLFGQWAKARGYKVIGTVSSPEKAALAKKNGYKWVIDYTKENIVDEVKKITKGKASGILSFGIKGGRDSVKQRARLRVQRGRSLRIERGCTVGEQEFALIGKFHQRLGPRTFECQNREQFVRRIVHIGPHRRRHSARNPEEPEQGHHVIDANRPAVAQIIP